MENIQLELNIENLPEKDFTFAQMQKQIDASCLSMDKVRRKLFAEQGEMKKLVESLKIENIELRQKLEEIKSERTNWTYGKEGCLFDVQKVG